MYQYTMTTEEESSLFDRRIKLLELIILTVTAIIALMSFTKLYSLVWSIVILGIDTIFLVLVIVFCANKERLRTTFKNEEGVDATKVEISYKLQRLDIAAFILYIFAIVLFGIFFSDYTSHQRTPDLESFHQLNSSAELYQIKTFETGHLLNILQ